MIAWMSIARMNEHEPILWNFVVLQHPFFDPALGEILTVVFAEATRRGIDWRSPMLPMLHVSFNHRCFKRYIYTIYIQLYLYIIIFIYNYIYICILYIAACFFPADVDLSINRLAKFDSCLCSGFAPPSWYKIMTGPLGTG